MGESQALQVNNLEIAEKRRLDIYDNQEKELFEQELS